MAIPSAPSDAISSHTHPSPAQSTATNVSAVSLSAISSPSGVLSPSRSLKRTRDTDSIQRQLASPFPTLAGDEPPSKRVFASPSTTTTSPHHTSPSVAASDSLRISNEVLRSENADLQHQLTTLQTEKAALDTELTQQKQRVRNLEEDLTRIYRRQKREAETRQATHTQAIQSLEEQLERLTQQLDDRPVLDPSMTLLTPETTQEMDTFVAMCTQWQHKLTRLSAQVATQVTRVEHAEIQAVVDGMVHKVDDAHRLHQVQAAEKALELQRLVLQQQEYDIQTLAQRLKTEREDVETFESMERLVLEQRIAEVEKTLENANENERVLLQQMAVLRDEVVQIRSENHVLPQSEWQQRLEKEAQTKDQLEALTVRCEAQNVQLTVLREDLTSLQAENDELAADLTARKQAAAGDDDTTSLLTQQLEDRITDLKEQLVETKKTARENEAELQSAMLEETETLKNRIEVLTLNVEAKAKVIENLSIEKTELLARIAQHDQVVEKMQTDAALVQQQLEAKDHTIDTVRLELSELEFTLDTKLQQALEQASTEKLALEKQMTTKTCDWVELNRELKEIKRQLEIKALEVGALTEEKATLESRITEMTGLEAKYKELLEHLQCHSTSDSRVQDHLASVEREKQLLQAQVAKLQAQGTRPPAQIQNASLTPETQARVAKLLVEKRAVETFLQQYFEVAEAKCQSLSAQVAQLETKHATQRQHAQQSCHLLRMCTQTDACDSTVRASLLDVMSTLESIS